MLTSSLRSSQSSDLSYFCLKFDHEDEECAKKKLHVILFSFVLKQDEHGIMHFERLGNVFQINL